MNPLLRKKTFLDLFPAPEFLLFSNSGIDITDENIKFVQLRREIFGDGFKLIHSSKMENPSGAIEFGLITNPAELTVILKQMSSRFAIRYARANLPEEKAYLFTTNIGKVPPESLKDAVAFIIEENVPVSLAESVFDYEIVSEDSNSNELKVTVSVLPKNVVKSYMELFESAGITPISFSLESQAIARAVIRRGDKEPTLIVSLSLKKTGFYVVEDEVVQFSTTPAYGIGTDESYPSLNDLKAEMRKVIAFWNARTDPLRQSSSEASKSGNPARKIEKAILCGVGASKKDFVEKLMADSGLLYAPANVWQNTSSSGGQFKEISLEESLDYASVIGLVLPDDK